MDYPSAKHQEVPLDIFIYIASLSIESWRSMCSIPAFGRFTLTSEGRECAERLYSIETADAFGCTYRFLGKYRHHRKLPSISRPGVQEWFLYNKLHREGDLPAIVESSGRQEWYKEGELHRDDDKPAHIASDGTLMWLKCGLLHRNNKDLPAIIWADGTKEFHYNGKKQTFISDDSWIKKKKK
eukprot:TRINITY_DN14091_c0_g1_i1.p1 TRINITY_DN14091_c0_g1~~TRINITY_DN14091_c0_g1_i1.p1  ORF type:complete len:183 (+),score=27.57 TRINITY_DN14091_c0_g1_i1:77-625(+)